MWLRRSGIMLIWWFLVVLFGIEKVWLRVPWVSIHPWHFLWFHGWFGCYSWLWCHSWFGGCFGSSIPSFSWSAKLFKRRCWIPAPRLGILVKTLLILLIVSLTSGHIIFKLSVVGSRWSLCSRSISRLIPIALRSRSTLV